MRLPVRRTFHRVAMRPARITLLHVIKDDPFAPQLDLGFEEPRASRRIWPVRELVGQVRRTGRARSTATSGSRANLELPAPRLRAMSTSRSRMPTRNFQWSSSVGKRMLLRFRPEDGLHVLVRGKVSVYEQRGQMQLVAETMEPVGARLAATGPSNN